MIQKWLVVLSLWPLLSQAVTLTMQIKNNDGLPLSQAVVTVYPHEASHPVATTEAVQLLQKDKKFSPGLLVMQQGSWLQFKNEDSIRHHVFSFSQVQPLDLELGKQESSEPIQLQKSGVITLGCNIHDWMQAHVVVSDSAFFAVSDEAGLLSLHLPDGQKYKVRIWHPALPAHQSAAELELKANELELVQFSFPVQVSQQNELDIDELGHYEE
jgi:plastocyanin